jgi:hypothetical protein
MMQDQFEGYTFEDYDRSTAENTRVYWFFRFIFEWTGNIFQFLQQDIWSNRFYKFP